MIMYIFGKCIIYSSRVQKLARWPTKIKKFKCKIYKFIYKFINVVYNTREDCKPDLVSALCIERKGFGIARIIELYPFPRNLGEIACVFCIHNA